MLDYGAQGLDGTLPNDWRVELRGASPVEPRSLRIHALIAIQGLLVVALLHSTGFLYRGEVINEVLATLLVAIGFAGILRWRRFRRLAASLEAGALLVLASMAASCQTVLLATLNLPYRDALLARMDRTLFPFLDWPGAARALATHAELTAAMCAVYSSLLWQPFLLVVALVAVNQQERLWRFVHAWILTLIACVAIFAVMPATTAYVHYGFTPHDLPYLTVNAGWRPAEIIAGIRSGSLHELGVANMSGLITFPSFHAAGAVLLAWGFRRVPVLGPCFVLLDLAMLCTVPLIGSHYFVDVLGGIVIAGLAILASGGWAARRSAYAAR